MKNRGYIFIELLYVFLLLAIITAFFSSVYIGIYDFGNKTLKNSEIEANLERAIALIIDDLEASERVGLIKKDKIEFTFDKENISYFLDRDNFSQEHVHNLKGKTLYRQKEKKNKEPVANFIKDLEFIILKEDGPLILLKIKVIGEGDFYKEETIFLRSE